MASQFQSIAENVNKVQTRVFIRFNFVLLVFFSICVWCPSMQQQPPPYQVMQRGATIIQQQTVPQPPPIITAQPTSVVVQPHASVQPPGVAISQGQANVTVMTTNVVDVHNRQIINVNPGTRDWSTGICGCFDDVAGCTYICYFFINLSL